MQHFLATLDIGQRVVETALKYKDACGFPFQKIIKREPANKEAIAQMDKVRQHIESFPKMESHYCMKDSQVQYLSKDLNIHKLYELYTEECLKNKESPVNKHMYRKACNTDYKLSFFKPKKDGCGTCEQHKVGKLSDEEYEAHITRKNDAQKEKK